MVFRGRRGPLAPLLSHSKRERGTAREGIKCDSKSVLGEMWTEATFYHLRHLCVSSQLTKVRLYHEKHVGKGTKEFENKNNI